MDLQLEHDLQLHLKQAFFELYKLSLREEDIVLQLTRKEFQGHFSLVVFPYVKCCGKKPDQLAHELGIWLKAYTDIIESYNVLGGFLNLVVADRLWLNLLDVCHKDENYGYGKPCKDHVVIEFSCPNTNKPQHLGHMRNNFIGSALANILKAAGYSVSRVNLINDRGIHICKSMVAYQQFGHGQTPESVGMKGDHFVGEYYVKFNQVYQEQLRVIDQAGDFCSDRTPAILKEAQNMLIRWEEGDPEVRQLWETMNGWVYRGFQETYDQLGIDFDKTYYESDTYLLGKDVVWEGLDQGCFYRKGDHAIAVDLSQYGLGEKILLRADGTAVYITQDLGTADLRYRDYAFSKMIYVVGDEQIYHFKVLFTTLQVLGRVYAKDMYHFAYGMVELPCGKMKSREGTVVDADKLMADVLNRIDSYVRASEKLEHCSQDELEKLCHTLALGAVKFFILRVNPKKKILFNIDDSIDFQGDTGTFIQYTYTRICSLRRKATTDIVDYDCKGCNLKLNDLEQALILQLYLFPMQVKQAADTYMPSVIANYVLELAKLYNKFYAIYPILKSDCTEVKKMRLLLSDTVGKILVKGMKLLGIDLPEYM